MPRPTYFFAIETTSRRFASVSLRLASKPLDHAALRLAVLLRLEFARFDRHRQLLFFVHREQRDAPDLLEIHADRIVERQARGQRFALRGRFVRGRLLFFLAPRRPRCPSRRSLRRAASMRSGSTSSTLSKTALISSYVSDCAAFFPRSISFLICSSSGTAVAAVLGRSCGSFLACHNFSLTPFCLKIGAARRAPMPALRATFSSV
jgi:hypothetical protein